MLSRVHPSPRNSRHDEPDQGSLNEQLPIIIAVAVVATVVSYWIRRWPLPLPLPLSLLFPSFLKAAFFSSSGVVKPKSIAALWAPFVNHSWAYGQRNWELNLARVGWTFWRTCPRTGGWWAGKPLLSVLSAEEAPARSAKDKAFVEIFILR